MKSYGDKFMHHIIKGLFLPQSISNPVWFGLDTMNILKEKHQLSFTKSWVLWPLTRLIEMLFLKCVLFFGYLFMHLHKGIRKIHICLRFLTAPEHVVYETSVWQWKAFLFMLSLSWGAAERCPNVHSLVC